MTINELLAAAGLTGNDVIPLYDAEAATGTEPTQKIKASDFVAAMKTLGSLLGQSDVVNNLTSTSTTAPLAANQGKVLKGLIGNSNIADNVVTDLNSAYLSNSGILFFSYANTAQNRPAGGGGAGIFIGNVFYGIQIVYANRGADENLVYIRNTWNSGANWGTWKMISATA